MKSLRITLSLALMTLRSYWRRLVRPPKLPLPDLVVHCCVVDKSGKDSIISYTYDGHSAVVARGVYTKCLAKITIGGIGSAN